MVAILIVWIVALARVRLVVWFQTEDDLQAERVVALGGNVDGVTLTVEQAPLDDLQAESSQQVYSTYFPRTPVQHNPDLPIAACKDQVCSSVHHERCPAHDRRWTLESPKSSVGKHVPLRCGRMGRFVAWLLCVRSPPCMLCSSSRWWRRTRWW